MARKLYRARDKLVRKRVRGALVEENVRTKKRRKIGKTDEEREIVRTRDEDDDRREDESQQGNGAPRRLRNRAAAGQEAVSAVRSGSQKKRLRHNAEEVQEEARGKAARERERMLDRELEDDVLPDEAIPSEVEEDDSQPSQRRQRLKAGERYRDHERRARSDIEDAGTDERDLDDGDGRTTAMRETA